MSDFIPNILIVDDTPINIDILSTILDCIYEVTVAISGEVALEIVKKNPPDLILLDIVMPVMDGYEVCAKLKKDEKTRDIPVIFVTAKEEIEDEFQGFEIGAVDYITKPVVPAVVKARVKTHLELKLAHQKLKEKNERLETNLQLREDMANMVIYDIRGPLSSMLSLSELLVIRNGVIPECTKYLNNIQKAANNLHSLTGDMLMLAKTEKEELILDRSLTDIKELISTVKSIHDGSVELKEINFIVEVAENCAAVLDKKLFYRVLDNLITNALKFSPRKSTISIKAFTSFSNSKNNKVTLQISDEGGGIPPEKQAQIFDKYTILELKQKNIPSVGLGLAFCKLVVESHGGHISVENKSKGAVFTIEI